jgi:hypothetical protein
MENNNEPRVNPDKIKLQSIRPLTNLLYIDSDIQIPDEINYNVNFEVYNGVSIEANAVKIIIKVVLTGTDQEEKPLGINGEYACEFILLIDNLASFVTKDPKEEALVVLHGALAGTLMGICYSTFRGIVYSSSRTVLSTGIILPVLDPQKIGNFNIQAPDPNL